LEQQIVAKNSPPVECNQIAAAAAAAIAAAAAAASFVQQAHLNKNHIKWESDLGLVKQMTSAILGNSSHN